MLVVKPVYDDNIKEELCGICSVKPVGYAYFAAETDDKAEKIINILGVCTFNMTGSDNTITALAPAPGTDDEEALMIMCRAVMNFMYRGGVKVVRMAFGSCKTSTAEKLGFKEPDMTIDLEKFYEAPCKYTGS